MEHLPIHWYQGLFLRPHHFQASERHWNELIHTSERWDHPYNYGVRTLRLNQEALKDFSFQITQLEARMPSGTLVAPPVRDPRLAISDVREGFSGNEPEVGIYLCIPRLESGRAVAEDSESGVVARYRRHNSNVEDEVSGKKEDVDFRELNVCLKMSNEDRSGFEQLLIAKILRTGIEQATPVLDETYVPPALTINSWPQLGQVIIRDLYDLIKRYVVELSDQLHGFDVNRFGSDTGGVEEWQMLDRLNEAYSTLGTLINAEGVHPFVAYTELYRILSTLFIFTPDLRDPETLRPYDHDDLGPLIKDLCDRIRLIISKVEFRYQLRFFTLEQFRLVVSGLRREWFETDWEWYLGVNRLRSGIKDQECRDLLNGWDKTLGSASRVEESFGSRQSSIGLATPDAENATRLPRRRYWTYFEVVKEPPALWDEVCNSASFAIRLQEELVRGRTSEPTDVVTLDIPRTDHSGKELPRRDIVLQFALLLVKKQL